MQHLFFIVKTKIVYSTKIDWYPSVDLYVWPYYWDIIALVWSDPTSVLIWSPQKVASSDTNKKSWFLI